MYLLPLYLKKFYESVLNVIPLFSDDRSTIGK